jgi:AcrR family transcriptional regulator
MDSKVDDRTRVAGRKSAGNSAREATPAPKRRRSPVRNDSKAKAERIVTAATLLLDDHSLTALNMNMIAKAAGISRTSIYDFFSTTFAIFEEVARKHVMHSHDWIRDATRRRNPDGLLTLIDAHVDSASEYFNGHAAARKTLFGTAALELHAIDSEYDVLAARMFREFHSPDWPVEPLSHDDPYRTVTLLLTAIYSASVRAYDSITPEFAERAKLVARSYLLAALDQMGVAP